MTTPHPPPRLVALLALACGTLVANLYYAQALVTEIAPAIGLGPGAAGLAVTATQLGYGAGLLALVPLADLVENRRLAVGLAVGAALAMLGLWLARGAGAFLLCSFLAGLCSVAAQVLVPLAAHLAPDASRGRVVGNVMGGLIAGIMLARPLAGWLAAAFGWRAVFLAGAVGSGAVALLLARALPVRRPPGGQRWAALVASGVGLVATMPVLRRRTAYQALLFAAFSLFWTAIPLELGARFGLGPAGVAWFALAGAGGALAAPLAGRVGDAGRTGLGTAGALGGATLALAAAAWAGATGVLAALVLAAVLLDAGVQMNQVLGQRLIYAVAPHARGRINAAYMTCVFGGGAAGSLLGGALFARADWGATASAGAGLAGAALLLFLTERRGPA